MTKQPTTQVRREAESLLPRHLGADTPLAGARETVQRTIEELHRASAVDEGNGDVLDSLIEAWRAQHRRLIDVFYLDRRNTGQQNLADWSARLAGAELAVRTADEGLAVASTRLEGLRRDPDTVVLAEPTSPDESAGRPQPSLDGVESLSAPVLPRRRWGRPDWSREGQLTPAGPLGRVLTLLLLLAAVVGDVVNFVATLGVVAGDMPFVELVGMTVALTAAAVGAMHFAGISARKRRLAGGGCLGWSVVSLALLWLALGVAAFWLRAHAPSVAPGAPDSFDTTAGDFGVTASESVATSASPGLLLAIMMLCLYLATGGMAAWAAYNDHEPLAQRERARRRARRRDARRRRAGRFARGGARLAVRSAARRRARAVAEVARLSALVEQQREDLDRDRDRHRLALEACDAWAEELVAYSRLRLAAALGDPAATSALTAAVAKPDGWHAPDHRQSSRTTVPVPRGPRLEEDEQ